MAPDEFGLYGEASFDSMEIGPYGESSFDSMEIGPWSEEWAVEVILNPSEIINSESSIKQTYDEVLNSNSYILKADNDKTIYSNTYILKSGNDKVLYSNANIKRTYSQAITSEAFILVGETESLLSDAYILKSGNDKVINSVAYITFDKELPHGFQRSMWYDGARYWRSSYDYNNSRIIFEYTTNKVDWTENTSARISANAFNQEFGQMKWADFFVFSDDGILYTSYKSGNDIKARKATGYPGAGFSWGSEYTALDASVDGGEYLYCTLSTRAKDRLVASATWHTGNDYRVVVSRGTAKNDVSAWDPPVTISSETNTNKATYNRILRYDTSNDDKYYVVWNEGTTLFGRYYGGSWSTTEIIATLDSDILVDYKSYFGFEHSGSTDLVKHVVYKSTDGSIAHRFNSNVSTPNNWTSEVIVSADSQKYSYLCIAENGVSLGEIFILAVYGDHPNRLVEICRSVSPYTTWSCSFRYIDSTVISLISESPTATAYTYQDNTTNIYTIFFQETFHIDSDTYIKSTYEEAIQSDSYIKITDITESISSDGWVLKSGNDKYIDSEAYILGVTEGSINSNARILQSYTKEIYSNVFVKRLDNDKTIYSNACVLGGALVPIISNSYIKKLDNQETINSNSYIKATVSAYPINSNSYVLQTYIKSIDSDAYVGRTGVVNTINSNAYMLKTYLYVLDSDSYISKITQQSISSISYIKLSPAPSRTIHSNSEIVYVGNVFLISPINGSIQDINEGDNVNYIWKIPDTYIGTGRIDCKLEIATDNLFTDIVSAVSSTEGTFEYYDGVNWQTYPITGIESAYFGNNARYVTTTNPGLYYWRVRGCVR